MQPGAETAEKLQIIEESVRAWQSPDQQMRSLPAELAVIIAAQSCYKPPPPFAPRDTERSKRVRCGMCFVYSPTVIYGKCSRCVRPDYWFCWECYEKMKSARGIFECIWCRAEPRQSIAIAVSCRFNQEHQIVQLLQHQYRGDCIIYDLPRIKDIVNRVQFRYSEYRPTSALLEATDTVAAPSMLIPCYSFCGFDGDITDCAINARERGITIKPCRSIGGN